MAACCADDETGTHRLRGDHDADARRHSSRESAVNKRLGWGMFQYSQNAYSIDKISMKDLAPVGNVTPPVSTGVDGLDTILDGGLSPNRLYLIEGLPGSGKTTMALQFLRDGAARGETVLYVTLSETEVELREVAASHGWSLDGIHIHELFPMEDQLDPEEQYTMFHPSEVELGKVTQGILLEVERLQPQRVVFDSLSEIRLLAGSSLRFRRQVLALKQYFSGRHATVLLLDEGKTVEQGLNAHTIVHEPDLDFLLHRERPVDVVEQEPTQAADRAQRSSKLVAHGARPRRWPARTRWCCASAPRASAAPAGGSATRLHRCWPRGAGCRSCRSSP